MVTGGVRRQADPWRTNLNALRASVDARLLRMRRRRNARLFALLLALFAGASCGDAAFDLLPAEARTGGTAGAAAGTGGSPQGGTAGAAPAVSGATGDDQPGGQGGTAPLFPGSGGSCSGPNCEQHCAPWGMLCVHCEDESDCNDQAPYCEPNFDRCVECRNDLDCLDDQSCDPLSGTCAPSCSFAGDCGDDRPLCDQARGICVECIEDAHCRTDSSSPFCVIGKCVECFTSQHCPYEQPYCDRFVCRECFDHWHCGLDAHCDDGICEDDF